MRICRKFDWNKLCVYVFDSLAVTVVDTVGHLYFYFSAFVGQDYYCVIRFYTASLQALNMSHRWLTVWRQIYTSTTTHLSERNEMVHNTLWQSFTLDNKPLLCQMKTNECQGSWKQPDATFPRMKHWTNVIHTRYAILLWHAERNAFEMERFFGCRRRHTHIHTVSLFLLADY